MLFKLIRNDSIERFLYELEERLTSFRTDQFVALIQKTFAGMDVEWTRRTSEGFSRDYKACGVEARSIENQNLMMPDTHSSVIARRILKSSDRISEAANTVKGNPLSEGEELDRVASGLMSVAMQREPGKRILEINVQNWSWAKSIEFGGGSPRYYGRVIHNGPPYEETANIVEYEFTSPDDVTCLLEIEYAAAAARPVTILLNRELVTTLALSSVTGGWTEDHLRWEQQGTVSLKRGRNLLRLERTSWFPHIGSIIFSIPENSQA